MANRGLTKNFNAGGTIPAFTICKFGADEKTVVAAAAATDSILGVSTDVDAIVGDPVDVQIDDIAYVIAGATVARGALVTSDAAGKAVAAAPAAGVNNRVLGTALQDAVVGDKFNVYMNQGSIQG